MGSSYLRGGAFLLGVGRSPVRIAGNVGRRPGVGVSAPGTVFVFVLAAFLLIFAMSLSGFLKSDFPLPALALSFPENQATRDPFSRGFLPPWSQPLHGSFSRSCGRSGPDHGNYSRLWHLYERCHRLVFSLSLAFHLPRDKQVTLGQGHGWIPSSRQWPSSLYATVAWLLLTLASLLTRESFSDLD